MVYHTIVASIATKNFEAVNRRDFESILKGCAPNIRHEFGGQHALGGVRNDKQALQKWFQRLATCTPDLLLKVQNIWVKGWPWDTTVFVQWTATATFPDGSPYRNHGVHIIKMSWGKVSSINANEDSQIVAKMLDAQAATGVKEAAMAPIES